MLSDLAFHLADQGRDVHVLTSRLRYESLPGAAPLQEREVQRRVTIHRLATTAFGRSGLAGRSADYASFYAAVWRKAMALAGPGDILVAKTDPPLLSIIVADAARRRSARLVNWTQDLYPEIAQELGVRGLKGWPGRALAHLRNRAQSAAAANVAIGDLMARRMIASGAPPSSVNVLPNWVPGGDLQPIAREDNPLRTDWGLQDTFVVGYSGNLGRAHEYGTLIDAAERLKDCPDLRFLFIGGGHHVAAAGREAQQRGLAHRFIFQPYQNQDQLARSLSLPDVHWVSLRPSLEGLIVPSKIYGIAAVARPILAVSDPDGEVGRLVRTHDCGFAVAPGDGAGLAAAIGRLQADRALCAAMGERARAMYDAHFNRSRALAGWTSLLEGLAKGDAPGGSLPGRSPST